MKTLTNLARLFALLGGLMLMGIVLITCASVIGRSLLDRPLIGDFELTAVACGVGIALFMPWCQLRRGHILVDFFTANAPVKVTHWLDRLGALLVAAFMALLAWRGAVGGINAWSNHASSMMLGVPHWWVYAGIVPPLSLCATIAVVQAVWPAAVVIPEQPQHTAAA